MRILKPSVAAVAALAAALATGAIPQAQAPDPAATLLEAAIQKQWVNGDVAGAIADYQMILDRFADDRRVAAQALWRLAQGQEQLGRLDDARRSYERLVNRYPDENALVGASRERLTSLDAELADDPTGPELGRAAVIPDATWDPRQQESYRLGAPAPRVVFNDLSVYDSRTGQVRRLVTSARSAAYPVLSPNGNQVAYLSWNGDLSGDVWTRRSEYSGTGSPAELRVVSIGGGNDRVLVRDPDIRWMRPYEWTADGRAVLALFERTSGLRQIALVSVNTGFIRIIEERPWLAVEDMGLSDDGRLAAYRLAAPRGSTRAEFVVVPVDSDVLPSFERRYGFALDGQRGGSLSGDDLIVHVLNRIGFGPRPGDIERVRTMGVDAYIEQQLHPEQIADPVVDAKIGHFRSFAMEIPELLEKAGPPVAIAGRRRATIFERPALVERTQAAAAAPGADLTARTSAEPRILEIPGRPLDYEAHTARIVRAVHSERQLFEVMVDFWMNHFNVNLGDDQLTPSFEGQAIRQHALGGFENLLSAVAHHPKMLNYLDNWRSSAPAEVIEGRVARARDTSDADGQLALLERMPFLKESKGLNENFARELLELHTMGVDSGYTQQDIIEVAKILTGWTIGSRGFTNAREDDGVFFFDPMMHVDGDKVVLGQTFRSGGVEEGETLLKMLAHRPETARFISTKLARRFIADDPPDAVVEAASRTFLETGGDIREVVRTILTSRQFRSSEYHGVKIKKPFELVASSLRAVNASFAELATYNSLVGGNRTFIGRMGEKLYNYEAPDGNPDVGPAWMNSNALLVRLEFANALATGTVQGVTADLEAATSLLDQLGISRPTAQQIEQHRAMLQAAAAATPGMGGRSMMMGAADARAAATAPPVDPAAVAVAVMLGSPQFQKR